MKKKKKEVSTKAKIKQALFLAVVSTVIYLIIQIVRGLN